MNCFSPFAASRLVSMLLKDGRLPAGRYWSQEPCPRSGPSLRSGRQVGRVIPLSESSLRRSAVARESVGFLRTRRPIRR